tara:strand:- start:1514 stop:5158 length:3645 start_codon:yes stop_codon:yes gene_type:complete
MSDRLELLRQLRNNPRRNRADFLRFRETAQRLRTGLTPAQRDLQQNYIPQATEAVDEPRERIRPLQFIFNLLQTGQFVTANIAQEIKESMNWGTPLSEEAKNEVTGIWDGIVSGVQAGFSGGRRGRPLSFTDVFFEGTPKEERTFGQKAVGFVADVLLDPTTYLTFGAGSVARAAAAEFAWTATRVALKESAPELAQRLGARVANSVRKGKPEDMLRGLSTTQKKAVRDIYNENFRRAMDAPGATRGRGGAEFEAGLQRDLQTRMNNLLARDYPDATDAARAFDGRLTREVLGDPHLRSIQKDIDEGFAGAGRREARFMGIRVPGSLGRLLDAPMRAGRQVFEHGRAAFGQTRPGQRFGDAWWGLLNGGPVDAVRGLIGKPIKELGVIGALRKQFGFLRTPFEQIRHAKMRQHDLGMHQAIRQGAQAVDQIMQGLSDDQSSKIRTSLFRADTARRRSTEEIADSAQDILAGFGDDPAASEALEKIETLMRQIREAELSLADEGIIQSFGETLNYFPIRFLDDPRPVQGGPIGSRTPGFTQRRNLSPEDHVELNKRNLSWALGDSLGEYLTRTGKSKDQVLDDLIENKGWSDIEIDLGEALKMRMQAHARVMARGNMIRQFREFGLKASEIPPQARNALGNIRALNIRMVNDPALEDYVFDEDMAQIIERVYDATSTNEGATALRRYWAWITRFWKGFATLTPRFHIRNSLSNEMTGYLKHGLRWMDPRVKADAYVSTVYALHKDKYLDFLTNNLNVSEGWVARRLNKRIGNKTLREIAEEAEGLGAIVPRGSFTREVDPLGLTKESRVLNNPLFRGSQYVGDWIENTARMQSYLLDYRAALGVRGGAEYAAREARKWFLDYDDLTPFEQNVMRNIIPFYTWMRKNIANQLSGLVLHGNMYSTLPKVHRLGQSAVGGLTEQISGALGIDLPGQAGASVHDEDVDFRLLEGWEQNLGVFPVWKDRDTGKALLFDPFFAYQDINNIPLFWEPGEFLPALDLGEGLHEVLSASHPVIKTIMEVGIGERGANIFKQRDIREEEIAPKIFQTGISKRIIEAFNENRESFGFMDGLMRLAGYEDGIKMRIKEDGTVVMDGEVERIMDNMLPMVRTIGSVIESAESLGVVFDRGVADVVEEVSSERDYNKAFAKMLRSMAFLMGTKLREFDEEDRQRRRAEEIRQEAERLRNLSRRQLPGFQQVSNERRQRRLLENQRLVPQ